MTIADRSKMSERPKLLLVDDEQQLLDGLARMLRHQFDTRTASSGAAGLAMLEREQDIAIVMSDMRMPAMSGAVFLAKAREVAPDAVRLLLTGQADVESAIHAVNEGSIFRFLQKPCAPDHLRAALAAAHDQHRLVLAERELLERTLRGAVQALGDTLALAAPTGFGAATRVQRNATALAERLGITPMWPLEIAAMMCQLGAIALPPGLYERRAQPALLTPADRAMLERIPHVTEQLLAPIPRLEPVTAIIRHALGPRGPADPAADVLRAVLELEEVESSGEGTKPVDAILAMRGRHPHAVVDALAGLFATNPTSGSEITISRLREGMVIAADVATLQGVLIVGRGQTVTASLLERLRNFVPSLPSECVRIFA